MDHDWRLTQDLDDIENWDAEESITLTISGVEVAEIFGTDHSGCIDEEDEEYPKIVADMQFVSRVIVNSKDMYKFIEKVATGQYSVSEAHDLITRINIPI